VSSYGVRRECEWETAVKETELWQRMRDHLGDGYYRVWAGEQHMSSLGGKTVQQAVDEGMSAKTIWRAVWATLELPDRDR
jgi:Protein of unknown function (DUF3046)